MNEDSVESKMTMMIIFAFLSIQIIQNTNSNKKEKKKSSQVPSSDALFFA